jgi:PAS domain S-box-containing protein
MINNTSDYVLNLLEEYKNILDISAIVTKSDLMGNITYANEKFCKISGYSLNELLGKNHNIVRHPDVSKKLYKNLWATIQNKKTWFGKIKNKSRLGKTYYVDVLIKPILDEKNEIKEYISLRYEITNFINPKQQLIDDIKDLKRPLLIVLQIKNYLNLKKIYKTNELIKIKSMCEKKISTLSLKYLKDRKVYSLSNGRFAILVDLKSELIQKYEIEIKEFFTEFHFSNLNNQKINYNIEMILAYCSKKINIYENLMRNLSFMEEKGENFNCCEIENIMSEKNYIHNINIIKLIKNSLINNNVKSFYQPIVCNKTGDIVKYESLIRIRNNKKIITPNVFLSIAKEGGYYYHLSNFVLDNTFKDLRRINKSISINISSLDIENMKFRTNIINLIENNKDISNRLTLEILEDEKISNINEIESFIDKVKSYGVKISIDDFGAGYSNFLRLKIFKPDYLKIDGSLIQHIEKDKYSFDLVKTIQNFAESQNILTIAEFVSDENIYKTIKNIGIDYSQGYYFAEPSELLFNQG